MHSSCARWNSASVTPGRACEESKSAKAVPGRGRTMIWQGTTPARSTPLTVERNPKYYNAEVVKQPKVTFLPIENRLTAWGLYKDGKCDWVTSLPLEQIDEIVKRPDYRGDTYLGTYFYSFNVTNEALKDVRVRKALTLAIDREIIVTKITKQGQKPAYWYVPPIFDAYKSPRFDVK